MDIKGARGGEFTSAYSLRRGASASVCGGSRPPPFPNWNNSRLIPGTGGSREGSLRVSPQSVNRNELLFTMSILVLIKSDIHTSDKHLLSNH